MARKPSIKPKGQNLRPLRAQAPFGSLLCFHVSSFPRPAGERLLCHSAWTFRQTRVSLRGYVTQRGRCCLAFARWILCSYAACRPGSRPSKSPLVPGTRGMQICLCDFTDNIAISEKHIMAVLVGQKPVHRKHTV